MCPGTVQGRLLIIWIKFAQILLSGGEKKSRILVVIIFKLLWKRVAQKVCGVLKQREKHPYSSVNTGM